MNEAKRATDDLPEQAESWQWPDEKWRAIVNKVRAGQKSRIRLTAFDQQVTPEVFGTLLNVSADKLEDRRGAASYYVARIAIDETELAKLQEVELVPGMPAEIFIQTGERVAISYLLKPLLGNFERAFKDGRSKLEEIL